MTELINVLLIVAAYLLGSIPTAVWIGKAFYDIDVREHGSGNAGATNTFRVLGKKAGVPVLTIDILKGWLAANLAYINGYDIGSEEFVNLQLALGLVALMGHIFPIYVGFKGGKGIATLLGVVLAIQPYAALVAIGVFLMIFLSTNYVSLSSIVAAITFPIITIIIFHAKVQSLIMFSMFIAVIVLITHQKNIERLLKGEESKTRLSKKKNRLED